LAVDEILGFIEILGLLRRKLGIFYSGIFKDFRDSCYVTYGL